VRARGGRTRPGPSGRLLERERELEALAAAVGAAADGTPGLVLVEGLAGIGKSRLLAAARTLADERGVGVLAERGGELERDFPFGIVRQLFESLLIDDSACSHLAQALSLNPPMPDFWRAGVLPSRREEAWLRAEGLSGRQCRPV
jgi:hypothetical protein